MATYCSNHSSYGCGHHREHQEAARKAWITRRGGVGRPGGQATGDETWFRELFPDAKDIHTHPNHKGIVTFKQGGKWFELPIREYRSMAREGRAAMNTRQKAEAQAARIAERERKRGEKAAAVAERKRERYKEAERKYRAAMTKMIKKEQVKPYVAALKHLRAVGIRPTYNAQGKPYDRGELARLPSGIVRSTGKITLDYAREWAENDEEVQAQGDVGLGAVGGRNYNRLETISDFLDWMEDMADLHREVTGRTGYTKRDRKRATPDQGPQLRRAHGVAARRAEKVRNAAIKRSQAA